MKTRLLLTNCAFTLMSILPLSAVKYYLYTGSDPWGTRTDNSTGLMYN